MYTTEQFRKKVVAYQKEYEERIPTVFWEDIALPWFATIFPVKNAMYGVEGLQILGPTHAVAEFVGCFYRWYRMDENGGTIQDAALLDSLHDAFGYSVIMRAMADKAVRWNQADRTRSPKGDLDTLVGFYWKDRLSVDDAACTMTLRIAINMYRRTVGA